MSFESAFIEAQRIHEYMIRIINDDNPNISKTFDASWTEYYLCTPAQKNYMLDSNTRILHLCPGSNHFYCCRTAEHSTMEFSRSSSIIFYNWNVEGSSYTDCTHQIDAEVLDEPWDSSDYYFQMSTVYEEDVLDTLVLMWYFKHRTDYPDFYLEYYHDLG